MKILLPLLIVACSLNALGQVTLFKVLSNDSDTQVKFVSDAPLDKVVGKTRIATGFVEFDPATNGASARGEIHVDLASLSTGVKLRDRHMRDNHLETDLYPEAVFTLKNLKLPDTGLPEGTRTSVTLKGSFLLHGVERDIAPEAHLTLTNSPEGKQLRIEADFTVLLEDYRISRPQFLFLKLSQEQVIQVDIVAKTAIDSAQLSTEEN